MRMVVMDLGQLVHSCLVIELVHNTSWLIELKTKFYYEDKHSYVSYCTLALSRCTNCILILNANCPLVLYSVHLINNYLSL